MRRRADMFTRSHHIKVVGCGTDQAEDMKEGRRLLY
jgi:hypothetical protein